MFCAFSLHLKENRDHVGPAGEINHNHGGRGVYFLDPGGNGMEVITQPYEPDRRRPASW